MAGGFQSLSATYYIAIALSALVILETKINDASYN